MNNVFCIVAGPGNILLTRLERSADRVQTRHKIAVFTQQFHNLDAHPRHDTHIRYDIGRIGNFDTDMGNG